MLELHQALCSLRFAPDSLAVLDSNRHVRVLSLQAERLLGVIASKTIGKHMDDLWTTEAQEQFTLALNEAVLSAKTVNEAIPVNSRLRANKVLVDMSVAAWHPSNDPMYMTEKQCPSPQTLVENDLFYTISFRMVAPEAIAAALSACSEDKSSPLVESPHDMTEVSSSATPTSLLFSPVPLDDGGLLNIFYSPATSPSTSDKSVKLNSTADKSDTPALVTSVDRMAGETPQVCLDYENAKQNDDMDMEEPTHLISSADLDSQGQEKLTGASQMTTPMTERSPKGAAVKSFSPMDLSSPFANPSIVSTGSRKEDKLPRSEDDDTATRNAPGITQLVPIAPNTAGPSSPHLSAVCLSVSTHKNIPKGSALAAPTARTVKRKREVLNETTNETKPKRAVNRKKARKNKGNPEQDDSAIAFLADKPAPIQEHMDIDPPQQGNSTNSLMPEDLQNCLNPIPKRDSAVLSAFTTTATWNNHSDRPIVTMRSFRINHKSYADAAKAAISGIPSDGIQKGETTSTLAVDYPVQAAEPPSELEKAHPDEDWVDFDKDHATDPVMAGEYVVEIFEYMLKLEKSQAQKINPNYIETQTELTWKMRGILGDHLIQIHRHFKLHPETMHLAMHLVDRFLSIRMVACTRLQLVGLACLMIAAKYEEIIPPSVKFFVRSADQAFTEADLLNAERYILRTLGWDLSYPSIMAFLRRANIAEEFDSGTRNMGKFLMEIVCVDHRLLPYPPSQIAAAALWLSRLVMDRGAWNGSMIHYSGYHEKELVPPANVMLNFVLEPKTHECLWKKYASKVYLKASLLVREWALARWKEEQVVDLEAELPGLRQGPSRT